MKKALIPLVISLGSLLVPLASSAVAQVFVNGQLMQGQKLTLLESLMGSLISAGRYWVDQNGNWGYEGSSTIRGNLLSQQSGNEIATRRIARRQSVEMIAKPSQNKFIPKVGN
ncbi:MAG: hypothetical protein OHK0037_06390 [Elainellaceae cyanobacterium]